MSEEVLRIEKLAKNYKDSPDSRDILSGFELSLDRGEFLCILGPSGCGKTTLIRCIAGFESYEGEIRVGGKKVSEPGPDRVMVFQDYNQLFPWKSVLKNVEYPLVVQGVKDKAERTERAMEQLRVVNLEKYADYYPHQLSGGMKQRVAIARGLVMNPLIILMDEPFAALDAITRNRLQAEVRRIKEEKNSTVMFITHNIQEAIVLSDRILLMNKEGKTVIDKVNPLPKPVYPASEGFAQLWNELKAGLYDGDPENEF